MPLAAAGGKRQESYSCGTTFQLQYGTPITIQSPPYRNNVNCRCTVNAPTGEQIRVQFLHLDLELNYDYVTLNGKKRYSGATIPDDYLTSGNRLDILFTTDGGVAKTGFRLKVFTTGVDNTSPTVKGCPDDIAKTNELGASGVLVTWIEPSATDVSPVTLHRSHQPSTVFPVGVTDVAYIFIDASNNVATCTFSVTVETVDTTPPTVTDCPTQIETTTELGTNGTYVNWTEPSAMDLSGTPEIHQTHTPATLFLRGVTVVSYLFLDISNNTANCTFQIVVETVDTTPPVVSNCPTDFDQVSGRNTLWNEPTVFDLSENITEFKSNLPGFFLVDTTHVSYSYTDSGGNVAYCNFTINVAYDFRPPLITGCPSDIYTYAELGETEVPVFWTEPFAEDDNGRVMLISVTHSPGESFDIGSTSVIYTFADDSYNTRECRFNVTIDIVDSIPPNIHDCPSDIVKEIEVGTSSASVFWIPPTATDVSGNITLVSQSHHPGDTFAATDTSVAYIFSDGSGNTNSGSFDIDFNEVQVVTYMT
ncbi:hyalin-like [Amphiura filiformis]|uniref:hyalin-like n=1 Tax=Amphiura filiformis TaxID=82378 RepID=UPI003B218238